MRNFLLLIIFLALPNLIYAAEPFAVVELFTSEGCSSCPPADQLLQEITQKAEKDHLSIYTLGFHVDYWNNLGWKDKFSQPAFTSRQYIYASKLNSTSVYTPQMIVNGQIGFTGSDRNKAWMHIKKALKQEPEMEIGFTLSPLEKNQYQMTYYLAHIPADSILNIAVLEKNISSEVTKGENSGRILTHTQVVRYFSSSPMINPSATAQINISPDWKKENLTIIVYVQSAKDMRILGASQTSEF